MIARLDHIICEVPDIRRAFQRLHAELGFPIAWPIGPFWPDALTAGLAFGGFNLELVESSIEKPAVPVVSTLVFEPTSILDVKAGLAKLGLAHRTVLKMEDDPELLCLRGFDSTQAETPQEICTNVIPHGVESFFFCRYSPFLTERLAPSCFEGPYGEAVAFGIESPSDDLLRVLLKAPAVAWSEGPEARVKWIQFEKGGRFDMATLSF